MDTQTRLLFLYILAHERQEQSQRAKRQGKAHQATTRQACIVQNVVPTRSQSAYSLHAGDCGKWARLMGFEKIEERKGVSHGPALARDLEEKPSREGTSKEPTASPQNSSGDDLNRRFPVVVVLPSVPFLHILSTTMSTFEVDPFGPNFMQMMASDPTSPSSLPPETPVVLGHYPLSPVEGSPKGTVDLNTGGDKPEEASGSSEIDGTGRLNFYSKKRKLTGLTGK